MIAVVTTAQGSGVKIKALEDLASESVGTLPWPIRLRCGGGSVHGRNRGRGLLEAVGEDRDVASPRAGMQAVADGEADAGLATCPRSCSVDTAGHALSRAPASCPRGRCRGREVRGASDQVDAT